MIHDFDDMPRKDWPAEGGHIARIVHEDGSVEYQPLSTPLDAYDYSEDVEEIIEEFLCSTTSGMDDAA